MKKRNLFITLGLAMGLGLGVAAGLGAEKKAIEAKAAGEEYVYTGQVDSDAWVEDNTRKLTDGAAPVEMRFYNGKAFKFQYNNWALQANRFTGTASGCFGGGNGNDIYANTDCYVMASLQGNGSNGTLTFDYIDKYQMVGDAFADSWDTTPRSVYQFNEEQDGTFTWTGNIQTGKRFRIIYPGVWQTRINWNNVNGSSAKVSDGTFVQASTVVSDSDNNIYCTSGGTYVFTIEDGGLSIEDIPATQYTVSYDENGDSTIDETEKVIEGETIIGYTPFKYGYHFDYWTLGGDEFNPTTPITGNITLVAHWTALTADEEIYVITGYGASWSGRYIYAYDSTDSNNDNKKNFGVWPGMEVEAALQSGLFAVTTSANFGGSSDVYWNGGVMKIGFFDEFSCDKVIFHNNNGKEVNLDVVDGAGYFYNGQNVGECQDVVGVAAKVVFDYDAEFGADDPHCSTAPAKAAELYNAWYDARLVEGVAGWLDSSVVTSSNIRIDTAAAAMKMIVDKANDAGGSFVLHGSGAANVPFFSSETASGNSVVLIIAIVSGVALIGVASYFLLRRRKED